jgi:hypothetical protein
MFSTPWLSQTQSALLSWPQNVLRQWTQSMLDQDPHEIARARKAIRIKLTHLTRRECAHHQQQGLSAVGTSSESDKWQRSKELMLRKGWCIHQVRHLCHKYDPTTLAYLATLNRSPMRTNNHQRCLQVEKCVAYNTDPLTYDTKHVATQCRCAVIHVPYDALLKVIRKGQVPLIVIETNRKNTSQALQLRVEARNRKSEYVAVSHVWADGLGNPHINGLPLCQLERLRHSRETLQDVRTCNSIPSHQSSCTGWKIVLI